MLTMRMPALLAKMMQMAWSTLNGNEVVEIVSGCYLTHGGVNLNRNKVMAYDCCHVHDMVVHHNENDVAMVCGATVIASMAQLISMGTRW